MPEKVLILHIPVIHRGYLSFLDSNKERVSSVYMISDTLFRELSDYKPDIASLDFSTSKKLLECLGYNNILILSESNLKELSKKEIILVQDEVSRNLYERYLRDSNVEWASVFLRWDREKVLAEIPNSGINSSNEPFDIEIMKEAYKEAEKSSDWWRQIGAVLVKDGKIIVRSYNQGVPTDHSPYQVGSMRDLFKAGEKQEFSPTIHAEQKLIAEAAKNGLSLEDSDLYLTHFPCPLCSKLVAWSGIKKVYFSEGASNLDGKKTLESAGVEIIYVRKP